MALEITIAAVLLASLHFGQEYRLFPGQKQKKLVQSLLKQGTDIIMGKCAVLRCIYLTIFYG